MLHAPRLRMEQGLGCGVRTQIIVANGSLSAFGLLLAALGVALAVLRAEPAADEAEAVAAAEADPVFSSEAL